jgi:hypothetical protein
MLPWVWQALLTSYEQELLSYLNNPEDATQLILLYQVLSAHAPNEEYLDEASPEWIEVCSQSLIM